MRDPAAKGFGPRDVAFGAAMAEIPGHYRVAIELYLEGEQPAALLHASHPIMEVLPAVYEDLLDHDLAAPVAWALGAAATVVREGRSGKEVNDAFEAATRAGRDAIYAVVGAASGTPAYSGSVIAALLRRAAARYQAAVEAERVRLAPEYQDAYGFVRQAARMCRDLLPHAGDSGAEIEAEFMRLEQSVPGPALPNTPVPPDLVTAGAQRLNRLLEVALGALLQEHSTPTEVVRRIESRFELLEDVLAHGEKGRAEKLVARIYAEDYRAIEGAIGGAAPELHHALELLLREELRLLINRGASPEELGPAVARARDLLDQALRRLD